MCRSPGRIFRSPAAPPANASFHLRSLADIKAELEAAIKQRKARNI